MHLTRVTSGSVGHAAATGGDADPLALLLGGENGIGAGAFPATLQAALAEGEASGAGGDAGDDGIDVTDLLATDAEGDDSEDGATSLDAALAAALALGAAVVATPAPEAAASGSSGEITVEGAGGEAAAIDTTSIAVASTGPVIPGDATTSAAAKVGTETAAAVAEPVVDPAATTATRESSKSSGEAPVRATAAQPETATETAAPSVHATTTTAAALATSDTRPTTHVAHVAHVDTGTTALEHHATSGVAKAGDTTPFSSGGGDQHGLDLGTPERELAGLSVEKPTHAASPVASSVAAADPIAQAPMTSTAPAASSSETSAALPPASPPLTPHETTTARSATVAHHPGVIEARWTERVTDALRLSGARGGNEIRLQLEPEGLGHIDVRLHLQADGVRAVIVAEHESTRALLTSQQHLLQNAFDRSDLRLSGFSVDVGSGGGAATFGHERDGGTSGGAPGAATTAVPTAVATQDIDSTGAPLASGRLSVRV